jgi:hypothetical protein
MFRALRGTASRGREYFGFWDPSIDGEAKDLVTRDRPLAHAHVKPRLLSGFYYES